MIGIQSASVSTFHLAYLNNKKNNTEVSDRSA